MAMTEKLREYALVSEIVSAIAIVCSLIFVGVQVRQSAAETAANSEAIQSSVREAMLQTETTLLLYAGEHGLMSSDPSPEQLSQWQAVSVAIIRARENAWLQHRNGILDDATYLSYRDAFIKNLADDRFRQYWREVTSSYDLIPGFVEDIDSDLSALYGYR